MHTRLGIKPTAQARALASCSMEQHPTHRATAARASLSVSMANEGPQVGWAGTPGGQAERCVCGSAGGAGRLAKRRSCGRLGPWAWRGGSDASMRVGSEVQQGSLVSCVGVRGGRGAAESHPVHWGFR